MGDDGAGAYDRVAANRDTWQHRDIAAKPYVVAHMDGFGPLDAGVASLDVDGMDGRVEAAVGTNKDVVAKGHLSLVEDGEVEVGKEMFAQLDVTTVVAMQRHIDVQALARRTKVVRHTAVARVDVSTRHEVNLVTLLLTGAQLRYQPRVVGSIPLAV